MAKKATAVAEPKSEKKKGLRKKQIQFLKVLAKSGKPLTRPALCKAAKAHPTNVTANALGYVGKEAREKRDAQNGYPCLITLGYVKAKEVPLDGDKSDTLYEITPKGEQALAKAEQASE